MYKIKENIIEVIKDSAIQIVELDSQKSDEIRKKINQLYCRKKNNVDVFWDDLLEYSCISDTDAWRLLKKMVKSKCVLFFNKSDEKSMFLINSGNDLDFILSETYGFEFYVTDLDCSYLLCFNHHDILYGCGAAYDWVKHIVVGKAQMDIDFNHTDDGIHEFPHIHIWDWSKKPPRQESRN